MNLPMISGAVTGLTDGSLGQVRGQTALKEGLNSFRAGLSRLWGPVRA